MKAITREEEIMSGENLTPITRKELFLAKAAGQSVITPPPITREEMFLSRIVGGGSGGAPALLQEKTVAIGVNGTYVETPTEGYDGMSRVTITVSVPEQQAIIDVEAFPNPDNPLIEELDKQEIYKLSAGAYENNADIKATIRHGETYIVDELPEIGEPCTLDGVNINSVYYKRSDRTVYAYVSAEIAPALGADVGWYDAGLLLQGLGFPYGGVVTNFGSMTETGTLYFLENATYFAYSDVAWVEYAPAVGDGSNDFTETPVISSFDNTGDGIPEVYFFSKELPKRFANYNYIKINAVTEVTNNSGVHQEAGSHYMKYDEVAAGIGTLPPHVYCYDNSSNYLRYEFFVEESGIYELAAHLRIKDEQLRGATYTINKGTKYEHAFVTTHGWSSQEEALAVRDESQGAYMSGMLVHLHAGNNTIHITNAAGVTKNQHFRKLYLVKTANLHNPDLTMDKAEAMGVGLAEGAKLPDYYYITITFNNGAPRASDGFCRVITSNGHKMSIQKITLGEGQTMPLADETVLLRGKIGCVNSAVNGSIGQEARIFDATLVGCGGAVSYQTCEIKIVDEEGCAPFDVTYETYEDGEIVYKTETVPYTGILTINAIQTTQMIVNADRGFSNTWMLDDNNQSVDMDIRYENGKYYITVPNMAKCSYHVGW